MRIITIIIITTILVLATVPAPQAQERISREKRKMEECGTRVSPRQFEIEMARKSRNLNLEALEADPPIASPYYLPLTIHIVRKSDGTGGLTLDQLRRAMQDVNFVWQPVGVQFFIYGNIDYINSDANFNLPGGDNDADDAKRDALRGVNVVANTINVYFTNIDGLCGEGSFSGDAAQGVLMNIDCAGVVDNPDTADRDDNPSSFAHELGHYFDLYHTHETWVDKMGRPTKVECPNGSNCSTTGDLLCDTPADPNLSGRVNNACSYNNSATTPAGCGGTYNPLTMNLMSYSRKHCRTQITGDQTKKILQVLRDTANRKNLIIKGARYVDPQASAANADCSYNFPCRTVTKAIQVALNGDFIFIKPGSHQASQLGGKRVTLSRWGTAGAVQIRP